MINRLRFNLNELQTFFMTVIVLLCSLGLQQAYAGPGMLAVDERMDLLGRRFETQLNGWVAHFGDVAGAEAIDFDDSSWEKADVGYQWETPYSICWFRRWVEVPQQVGGLPVKGARLAVRIAVDNGGGIYVDGELKQAEFERASGFVVLSESARPGERYLVAVRGINRPGWGSMLDARLESSTVDKILPPITALLEKLKFARTILQGSPSQEQWASGLTATLDALDLESLNQGQTANFLASVDRAEKVFQLQVVAILRETVESRLSKLTDPLATLLEILQRGESKGLDLSYQRVTATVASNFLQFAKDDLSSEDIRLVTRGMWNLDWLKNATVRAIEEAQQIIEDPTRQRAVPRYQTGPVEIREGAFWQNDRPLQFVGMGHFGQVKKDIPIFPDYGFSIAQITISVGSILKGENEVNTKPIDDLVEVLDRAAKHNVAIDLLIEPHGWPSWANQRYPELASDTAGSLRYKIDHPNAKAILERYLDILIPRIADHPALFSYCLFNEPSYMDTSEYSHEKFKVWLAKKHGDLKTLNQRYRSDYQSFADVPLPAGILDIRSRGEKPLLEVERALVAGTPELYDWYRFNQDRLGEAHQRVIDKVHSLDPDTPVHSKVMGKMFDTALDFNTGVDHQRWCASTDISGNDNWSYYRSWTDHDKAFAGKYACNWWRQAMYYDFQRSVEPTHPIFNSENHPIEDDTPIWVPEHHVRTVYWQGAIHGQGATTTWVWERGDGASLGDCIISRSNCTHALGTIGLDLLRLGPEVTALQQIRPEIAMLVVPASIPFSEDYLHAMKVAFEGLHFLGAPIGFATEQQAMHGELSRYKAVVVPGTARVPDELVEQIEKYVAAGGTLIVSGNSFTLDEYGQQRDLPPFLPSEAGQQIACQKSYSKGTVFYRPANTSLTRRQAFGESLMADLDVKRPIRLSDEMGAVVNGVEYRSIPYRDGYLVNLVNYRRHEVPVRILAPYQIKQITNLFDGEPADRFMELAPLEPHLLYVETIGE